MVRFIVAAALAACVAIGAGGPARAEFGVQVGILTCDISGGAGLIIASRKTLACRFDGNTVPDDTYDGSITKVGIDVGGTAAGKLVWAVFAPSTQFPPGALEGRYYGVSAEVTPGVGLGANVLVGGFDSSINLWPVSVQGQVGANVAAAISGLRLKSPPPAPAVRKR